MYDADHEAKRLERVKVVLACAEEMRALPSQMYTDLFHYFAEQKTPYPKD
ncbi:MAG: hypothetical protein ACRD3W_21575 [Terriglobales bacterium]